MVNTSILLGVALATLSNMAAVTAIENPLSLDTTLWTANETDFVRMPDEESYFDHGSSILERKKCSTSRQCADAGGSCIKSHDYCDGTVDHQRCKGSKCKCCIPEKCPASRQCTYAGGYCIKSKAVCDGKIDPKGCKGRKCKCCLPDQTTPAPATCPTCQACPEISEPTCEPCPTRDSTTTPAMTTTPDITTIPAITTTIVFINFERINKRLIRRTISSDRKSHWEDAMLFCNQFGATPFIPRVANEFQLYKEVDATLPHHMWLPANDIIQEGTLRWYNGEIATNLELWDWAGGQVLKSNSESLDCLFYGNSVGGDVHLTGCNSWTSYPPICEKI